MRATVRSGSVSANTDDDAQSHANVALASANAAGERGAPPREAETVDSWTGSANEA